MAQIQCGCTITTLRTKLSSELMMGYRAEGDKHGLHWWMQVWGRLSIGTMSGNMMYAGDGIVIARTNDTTHPGFISPLNILVELSNVPERYAEKVAPDKTLSGKGKILLTNEVVDWEMWYPTRPIKK